MLTIRKILFVFTFFLPFQVLIGCDGYNPNFKNPKTTPLPRFKGDSAFLGSFNYFGLPKAIARIEAGQLYEASGLTQLPKGAKGFFSHNDGNDNRLFYLDLNGKLIAVKPIKGWNCKDWEEITPIFYQKKWRLLAADFGSNFSQGTAHQIAIIDPIDSNDQFNPKVVASFPLKYPDGDHDCEAFFFDSSSQKIYFLTKRDAPGLIYSFSILRPTTELQAEGTFPLHYTVACSISPNGKYLLVKTLKNVVLYIKQESESWVTTLRSGGYSQPYYKESQGESISLNADLTGYYTLSERCNSVKPAPLYYYPLRKTLP